MDKMPHEKAKGKKTKFKEKAPPPLKNQGDLDLQVKTPFLWVLLLAAPIVFGLLVSFRGDPPPPTFKPAVPPPRAEAKTPAPSRVVLDGRRAWGRQNSASPPVAAASAPSCDFAPWVGLRVDETMREALRSSGRPFRELKPDAMMTMDHAPARVNFDLDGNGIITRVWCG